MIILLETDVYKLSAEVQGSTYHLHFDYKLPKFTKFIYKALLSQWFIILEELKRRGVTEVTSAVPDSATKTHKWQLMFGLEEYDEYAEGTLYRRII